MKQHHAGELGEWVKGLAPWRIFGTGTFPRARSLEQTARAAEDFLARNLPADVKGFYSCELHPGGHLGHPHFLLAGFKDVQFFPSKNNRKFLVSEADGVDLFQLWRERFGEWRNGVFVGAFNSFELINDSDSSARYVAKCCRYAVKDCYVWGENVTRPFRKVDSVFEAVVKDVFPNATVLQAPTDQVSLENAFRCLSGTVRHKP